MLTPAERLSKQWMDSLNQGEFPKTHSKANLREAGLTAEDAWAIFKAQLASRLLDFKARDLQSQGEGFYTIGSSGHEGNAVFGYLSRKTDMAFLHYRSGAFMTARLNRYTKIDPIESILYSLTASIKDPISAGRHKVIGSHEAYMPPQTSTIASHLPKAVGTAFSIRRAEELKIKNHLPKDSVILCSFGDATCNHASAQAAFNSAAWIARQGCPMPLIFICEDNGLGISVPTPEDWIESMIAHRPEINYLKADGLNIADITDVFKQAEIIAREKHQIVFIHMRCVRLLGHAGSDIESVYLSEAQINNNLLHDPLLYTAGMIVNQTDCTIDDIIKLNSELTKKINNLTKKIIKTPKLNNTKQIIAPIIPNKINLNLPKKLTDKKRKLMFENQWAYLSRPRNMAQQLNATLTDLMIQYNNIILLGEDVGKKGGVYHVTADLQKRFGTRRVFDTLLDETTILGTSIGLAHNGFLPIPEIQFLAYLHNAEDQLRGEAASLSFFSNGQCANPMVIRIAAFGYQKGFGGHFHNDNSISILRDIPGIIVGAPSNGQDANRMLKTLVQMAYLNGRVCVLLEPIALYNQKDLYKPGDNLLLQSYESNLPIIHINKTKLYSSGKDLLIISYANGVYLSRQAEQLLKSKNIHITIMDLRWLVPLAEKDIIKTTKQFSKILIVDEGRPHGSPSEEVITLINTQTAHNPKIKRLTAENTFIPLGPAANCVLPSVEAIIETIINF